MTKVETRNFAEKIEVESNIVEGYALRFNQPSKDLGGFVETILPSALDGLDLDDVRALFNHDWNKVLGYTKSNTLALEIDEVGLHYVLELPDTTEGRDLKVSLERGDIAGSSFAFAVASGGDKWNKRSDGLYERSIHKIERITEISIVAIPAYDSANATLALRSLEEHKAEELRKLEQEQINIELELL